MILSLVRSDIILFRSMLVFPIFGWTLADNHLRGCYGVTGGVGRARKLAMRRVPGLDDIGGKCASPLSRKQKELVSWLTGGGPSLQ
ncbi:jg17516 [Pararge aegeria aegeria]|uniref:Jg17516 protein n=1 Tax=Pararge aegeria aegeria TaxID=348720 RepID=A0A8S4QH02_9NEOP|nr:jg17516 [Pararge aegeria aegeria]